MQSETFKFPWPLGALMLLLLVQGCSGIQLAAYAAKQPGKAEPRTEYGGVYKVGSPYKIGNSWYYPGVDYDYDETGIASWYGPNFHGKTTANGETYNQWALTAAHRTLPMPSFVQVTNLENGRTIKLRINDRGPYARGRIIDLSKRAAQLLEFEKQGTARVRVQIIEDLSRQAAARAQGGVGLSDQPRSAAESPAMARTIQESPPVQSQALAPPGAALRQAPPIVEKRSVASANADNTVISAPKLEEKVTVVPVTETQIYVQAGSFTNYSNANRVMARLAGIDKVRIYPTLVNGRDFFRVRIGPVSNLDQADSLLNSVMDAGYPEARIVVSDGAT